MSSRKKMWADNPELDLQLFKVAAATRLSSGHIPWRRVAQFVADGAFSDKSCKSRFWYHVNQSKLFCREAEIVQAAVRAAPYASQPTGQAQSGDPPQHPAGGASDPENDSDNESTHSTSSSASASSETEEQTLVAVVEKKKSKKKKKQKQRENSAESRKEKKKKARKQSRANAAANDQPTSTAGTSMSNIADIAQKEVLKAIGNALLQNVGQ